MKDHYAVLGVEKTATLSEIRSAYHKLALKHHPDRNKGSQASEDKFREISSAYNILSDERQRKMYDHERARPAPRPAPGGFYTPTAAPNEDAWIQKKKYEAVKNSYFYKKGEERRRSQNNRSAFRPGSGLVDPFADPTSTGLQAPIELGTPLKIVGDPPVLGKNVNVVRGAFGDLPGVFIFRRDS